MNYTPQVGNWQQQQGDAAAAAGAGTAAAGTETGNTANINQGETEPGPPRSTFVTQVEDNDVLMGRGAPIVDNEGNIRFRQLIRSRLTDYQSAMSRKEKDDIARHIAATVRSRSGLFLRKIESPQEAQSLGVPDHVGMVAWTCVDESAVLVKVKQALRDQGLEAEQEEKKKKAAAAGGGGGGGGGGGRTTSSSPRRRKRIKTSSPPGAAAAAASSSITAEAGRGRGGGGEPDNASAEGGSDSKIAAASATSTTTQQQSAESWQPGSSTAMQQQQQQLQQSVMSDAAASAGMRGGGNFTDTQQALLLNQLRQQQLRQQQLELEQRRNATGQAAAQMGFFDSASSGTSGGAFPYSPLGGQGVLGGSISRGGGTAAMAAVGGGGNMFGGGGGNMASIPELTNMDNSNLMLRRLSSAAASSGGNAGINDAAASAMMNQHLAGLRPGPRSLLNTAASSSSAMHYPTSSIMSSTPFARAGAQEDYRASPPGRASMPGGILGGGGLSRHGDGTTSLAHATNLYLGRPQLTGDMMMIGRGVGGGGADMASLSAGGFMDPMMRRGEQETTSIETVLQYASKLCQQLHAITSTTAGVGRNRQTFPDQFLSLTQIEVCILTVLCSTGLPLWLNSTMKSAPPSQAAAAAGDNVETNSSSWSSSGSFSLTWVNVANLLLKEASAKAAASSKTSSFLPPPPPPLHGGDNAGKDSSLSSLAAIASHYCKNPKELAQAAVMLLEKIRQHGDFDIKSAAISSRAGMFTGGSAKSDQAGNAPLKEGGMTMRPGLFLEAELVRWGTSLDVADSIGNPVPFCNADFLSSYPLVLRHDIVNICAVLDAPSCRTVFNHVANLTRLRDTFQKIPKDHLLVSLGQQASLDPTSLSSMSSSLAFLDRLPGTSQEERAHLDYSLLRSILELGFLGFFRDTPITENLLILTLRRAGLTKAAMEQRATLLIQALHAHFDARKRKLVIEEHNGKVAGLIAMAMASSSSGTT